MENLQFVNTKIQFDETTPKPELFNQYNNKIEEIIIDFRKLIKDSVYMKNIILGELQSNKELMDKNTLYLDNQLQSINAKLINLDTKLSDIDAKLINLDAKLNV